MKASSFAVFLLIGLCSGCSKRPDSAAIVWQYALDADAVVLAEVRSDGSRNRFFVKEVVTARLPDDGFFRVGRQIPGLSGGTGILGSQVVMTFRKPERLWACWSVTAVRDGEILIMNEARRSYATFTSELRTKG